MPLKFKRFLSFSFAIALSLAIVLVTNHPTQAQFSLPEGFSQNQSDKPPSEVDRYGNIEVASIESPLTGQNLFEIASPTVYDRSADNLDKSLAVERRAAEVSAKLKRAFSRPMNLETLVVEVSRLNNVIVIEAKDKNYPKPLVLVSVTTVDADYHGKPIDELADEWRDILETELRQSLEKLDPEALVQSLGVPLAIFVGLIALSVVVFLLRYAIARKKQQLRQRQRTLQDSQKPTNLAVDASANITSADAQEPLAQRKHQFLQKLPQNLSLERQLNLWSLGQWFLFWVLMFSWYIGIYQIMYRIPFLVKNAGSFLGLPIELLGIWFFAGLAIRLSRNLIDRVGNTWQEHDFMNLGDAQRRRLRTSTIAGAAKGMVTVLILTTSILWALNIVGIPTGSVLAIGGLLALAISLGSQNLVQDLVNGFLILAEDQYAIGDVIDLGNVAGLVENLNLRVTQLRSASGELITLPNSKISEVRNLTRTWSRVNFSIDVAYDTDPEKALSVLREVGQKLDDDPDWHDKIVATPEVLGIDSLSHSGMTITIWIQTVPAQQWAVGREFRFRVRKALEANGIEIGVPRQSYILEPSQANGANNHHQGLEPEAIAPDRGS